jgi:hypothetical protein
MGLVCNNVLHDRAGFTDRGDARRLLYRARYHDRVGGTHGSFALPPHRDAGARTARGRQ